MVNVESFIVDASIASLKVAAIVVLIATLFSTSNGFVKTIAGGVISGAGAVVKLHTKSDAIGLPAKSFTSLIIVAV